MPFIIENNGIPDIVSNEVFYLNFIVDLYPAASNSTARKFNARLTVGGDVVPVRSYQYTESSNDVAGVLNCELANLSDRTKLTRTNAITFEIGEYISGSWVWTTVVDTGRLSSSNFNIANNGFTPNDSVSMTATPLLFARLEKAPAGLVIIHDPARVQVNDEDLLSIPDIDGVEELVTVTPYADMMLSDVMDYVTDICGFAGYQTNIPDYPIDRVDFQPGEPYWNALAGIIGIFEPILDIDADDKLIIRDGTADVQPDTASARNVTVSYAETLGVSTDIQRFKGTLLTYQERDNEWDYWTIETDHPQSWFQGVVGQYPRNYAEIWYQKFYRSSFPNTPVMTRVLKEYNFIEGDAFTTIAASAEVFNYNNYGQIASREKREFTLAKVPQTFYTYSLLNIPPPIAGFSSAFEGPEEAYTSASDNTWTTALVLTRTEKEVSTYLAHPYESDSVYLAEHDIEARGLITRDTEDQQLGDNFEQPLVTAQRSGNLKEGLASYWGTVEYKGESQRILQNRQVKIRTRGNDSLNSSGLMTDNFEDIRVGDVGIQVIKPVTKRVYIYDEADNTATRIEQLNGGEAPLTVLRPLVIRRNRRQYYGSNVQMTLPGVDHSIVKGRIVTPRDRSGTSFGSFIVTGRTFQGAEGEPHKTIVTARQVTA